ncbi:MAG TPA: hypothetical protein VF453_20335 [Burkholderiaceae bacterium]
MNGQRLKTALAMTAAALALAACSRTDGTTPSRENFEAGLRSFLADGHDQLCLGMYDWPIDLTEAEAGAHGRHAVQLPVFEKLGLARSEIVAVPRSADNPDGAVKRYSLTDEGRKYYRPHPHKGRDGVAHKDDFCVARISLAQVEGWQLDPADAQHAAATVSYTYHIEPAPWMKDPEAQRVLPMVAEVIRGAEGGLKMHQGFVRDQHGWVPVPGAV